MDFPETIDLPRLEVFPIVPAPDPVHASSANIRK